MPSLPSSNDQEKEEEEEQEEARKEKKNSTNEYKVICRRNSLIHAILTALNSIPRRFPRRPGGEPGPSGLRNTNPKEREEGKRESKR